MSKPATLESIASAFDHWRNTRSSRKMTVPEHLREQAIELLNRYKPSHVIAALKINHSMLKQWRRNDNTSAPTPTPAFVTLANEVDVPTPDLASTLKISLRHSFGHEMSMRGEITPVQLRALVQSFFDVKVSQS